MKEKWTVKLRKHLEPSEDTRTRRWYSSWLDFKSWGEKHFMFVLPFITVLREGLEAVVFVAGVSFSTPPTSIPLPVIIGLIAGLAAQNWNNATGGDAAETGAGPGSYDIRQTLETRTKWRWRVGNLHAILGWQNSATYGSVISYNLYWLVVIVGFLAMRYKEVKGHLPLAPVTGTLSRTVKLSRAMLQHKQRAIYKDGENALSVDQNGRNSSGTSSVAKDPEKAMDVITEVPVHTISN
ncbi:hypothetical protein DID88_002815 [Monilinia fructigena]|uniref:Uncharacterized protein n=1 Tax=Monilinia fructigena TaxID=38457 RepID=A0A395ITS3_9HELO|nr:hypothetical protein DID88_002815 [Monilinia fructigena]